MKLSDDDLLVLYDLCDHADILWDVDKIPYVADLDGLKERIARELHKRGLGDKIKQAPSAPASAAKE